MELVSWHEYTKKVQSFQANSQAFCKQVFKIVTCKQSFFYTALCPTILQREILKTLENTEGQVLSLES